MLPCLSLLCFAVLGPPGVALDVPPAHAPAVPVQAHGRTDPSCRAWTDGCVTCRTGPDGGPAACSTPGLACTRGPVACRER